VGQYWQKVKDFFPVLCERELFMIYTRPATFQGKSLIIDGISGSGKTLLLKILDIFPNTSAAAFNYELEQLCVHAQNCDSDLQTWQHLVKLNIDKKRFDNAIAREVNLRRTDLSSILQSEKKWWYLRNLLKGDQYFSLDPTGQGKEFLTFVTHQLHSSTQIIWDSFPDKVVQVTCMRHPYYLLHHWESYIPIQGNSPRDFTISYDYLGARIPWFQTEFLDEYLLANDINKAAMCITSLMKNGFKVSQTFPKNHIYVDFESFVLDPESTLSQLTKYIGEVNTKKINHALRSQNVPRLHINDGVSLPIYKKYASDKLNSTNSMEYDFQVQEKFAKLHLTPSIFTRLEKVSQEYFDRFGIWFKGERN